MNYLLVNYEYPPVGGGAGTAARAIAHALGRAGNRVLVLTGSFGNEPRWCSEGNVAIHRVNCRRTRADRSNMREKVSFLRAGLCALPRLLRQNPVDAAIVFFSFPCGPIGLLARLLKGIPYVVSLRGGDVPGTEPDLATIHNFLRPLRRCILRRSTAIVANSSSLRDLSLAADPLPVDVIPNGVDEEFFRPATSGSHDDPERFRIVFTGRFQAQKNVSLLLDQCASLRTLTSRLFELHLIGDGPLRSELQDQARRLQLDVTWHGWSNREQLRSIYQRSHCFVNPSLYEGMPNAVLEAMACGLPVIASAVPGNDAVVQHGRTGFLFDLKESSALHHSLQRLIDDPVGAGEMGRNARAWIERDFSWNRVAAAYAGLFTAPN